MIQTKQTYNRIDWQNFHGIRAVVAAFGILCGLTGMIAGFFEIRQGNIIPSGFEISTIGQNYSMSEDFTYFAITIIPNLLITGILAVIVSSIVIIWSVGFVHKKNGVLILLGLSITQMLVGGGWVIDLALMTCVLATRIDKPLNWWRSYLPNKLQLWFAKLLPLSIVVYAIISLTMLVLTIIGVNDAMLIEPLGFLAFVMFIPIIFMIFGGIAYEIQKE